MTAAMLSSKEGAIVTWGILIASIIALGTYNYSLRSQQRAIGEQILAVRVRQAALSRKLQEGEAILQKIRDADAACFATDHQVRQPLRQCQSRDQFLIRKGTRIAWSELQGSSATEQKLGLYVPPGKHWLRWQTTSREEAFRLRGTFFYEEPYRLTADDSHQLPQGGQVYEICVALDSERKKAELTLLGDGNEVLVRSALTTFSDPCEVTMQVKRRGFSYPSQIHASYAGRLDFEKPQTIPSLGTVLALTDFTANGRSRGQTLLWIDSEARPCVSAIEIVANPRSFAQMKWQRSGPVGDQPRQLRLEEAVFDPYDDSDRLYFRNGLFGR